MFSQSILSLNIIEEFLGKVNDAHETAKGKDSALSGYLDTWIPGKDYYRMDGSTAPDTRKMWCKYFNKVTIKLLFGEKFKTSNLKVLYHS